MSNTKTLAPNRFGMSQNRSVIYKLTATQTGNGDQKQRQHQRFPTSLRAILYCRGQFQTTAIYDLSQGGAGLTGAFGVMPNDGVILQLLDGRQIDATVRWWVQGRCGLVFKQPLAENDILIQQAGKRSRVAYRAGDAKG
jgi:hypothetical protein